MKKNSETYSNMLEALQALCDLKNKEVKLCTKLGELEAENEDLLDINEKLIKVIGRLRKERKELEQDIE